MHRAALPLALSVMLAAPAFLCATPALAQAPPTPQGRPIFGVQPDVQEPAPAPAPPPRETVRLEYVAAPGCPDEPALRNALASRLGYDPVSPGAKRLLRVVVTREEAGFSARAELRGAAGPVLWSRPPLADADCRALVDVMGLSLKFAIDPASAAAAPAPVVIVAAPAPLPPPALPGPDRVEKPAPGPPSPSARSSRRTSTWSSTRSCTRGTPERPSWCGC